MNSRFTTAVLASSMILLFCGLSLAIEITQMPGWPKSVPGEGLFSNNGGLMLADVDGDSNQEVIVGTTMGKLYVWKYDGTEVFNADLYGLAQLITAVGDVTGDELPEIVVTTRSGLDESETPNVHVFSGAGGLLYHAPMSHNGSLMEAPTLADLNDDGKKEIIVGEEGSSTGWLWALNGDLTPISKGWPVTLDHVPATSAAVGDLDNDDEPEIVICSYLSVYAVETDGSMMAGFPVTINGESYSYGSPALADLNHDGFLEILTTTHGTHNKVHAFQYDGTELDGWPYDMGDYWSYAPPSVGDIDGDGQLEVVDGRSGGAFTDYELFVITHDGEDFGSFPLLTEGGAEGNFTLADFTGDDRLEIIFTSNMSESGLGYLKAVDADGQVLDGWPLRPEGFTYLNGVTLGDVDHDGIPEFGALGAKDDAAVSVNLYKHNGYTFGPGGVHWRTYQADDGHTGLYAPTFPADDDTADDDTTDDDSVDDDSADDDTATDDDIADDDTADDDSATDDDSGDDDNDINDDDTLNGADDDDDNGGCGL